MSFIKKDTGKPDMTLLPRAGLVGAVRALEYGLDKYGKINWQHAAQLEDEHARAAIARRYVAAALRHLHSERWDQKCWTPDESGWAHVYHAAAGLLMAIAVREGQL